MEQVNYYKQTTWQIKIFINFLILFLLQTFLFFSTLVAFCRAGTVAVAPGVAILGNAAPYLVRAPAHDSASIEHHRLGGNFAYSTAEAHAFAEVIPQISILTHPVAETTHTHIPAPIATHQPAPIVRTHHVAQPIFKNIPTFGTQAINGPVRTHQTVHQPIVHETRTHTVQAVSQAIATPVHGVSHVPVAAYAAGPVAHAAYAAAPIAHAAYAGAPIAHAAYAAAPIAHAAYAAAPAIVA